MNASDPHYPYQVSAGSMSAAVTSGNVVIGTTTTDVPCLKRHCRVCNACMPDVQDCRNLCDFCRPVPLPVIQPIPVDYTPLTPLTPWWAGTTRF